MKGRLHSIETFGTVDGPGIRTVFFMQGCPAKCLYCHNPDSWDPKGGERDIEVSEILHWVDRGRLYYGEKGGVTFSGGEPLLQGEFIAEAIKAIHNIGVKCAIDVSGTYLDEHTESAIAECDLVLLDIKHTDAEKFEIITGKRQDTLFEIIDIINKYDKPVWVRNVVVPDLNDTEEDIHQLNEFVKRIKHIDKIELLGYHTMAVNKYGKLRITYRLKGVPAMNEEKLSYLRGLIPIPE